MKNSEKEVFISNKNTATKCVELKLTIEQLAEKMGKTVWSKGNLKRIYLNDAGWNTKKMSTKTFIWQREDGEFQVSCKIDCPSQGWNWISSQQDEVIESVHNSILSYLATEVFVIVEKDSDIPLNEIGYSDIFYSMEAAEKRMNKDWFGDAEIKKYDREFFESEVERLDETEKEAQLS